MPTRSHANQLRTGRYSQSGQIYLLTAVTHLREPVFSDWRAGRLVVDQFRQAQTEGYADSLAWVVNARSLSLAGRTAEQHAGSVDARD